MFPDAKNTFDEKSYVKLHVGGYVFYPIIIKLRWVNTSTNSIRFSS
jgi:hypothetical protein